MDFYLSSTRNALAAKRFLGKSLYHLKDWEQPKVINTDKTSAYAIAIAIAIAIKKLKDESKYPREIQHWQIKYLNNIIESDHSKLKRLINQY